MNFTSFLVALPFIGQLITLIALGYFITYIPFKVFERLVFKKDSIPLTVEHGQRLNYWFDPNISLTAQEKELRDSQMMFSKLMANPLSYDFSFASDLRVAVQNRPPFESLSSEQLLEELLAIPSIFFHFDIVVAQAVIAFLQIEGQRRYPADFQSFRNFVMCASSEILVFPKQYKKCPRLLQIMKQRDDGMIIDEQKRLLSEVPEVAPAKRVRQKI